MFASDRRHPADVSHGEALRRSNQAVNDKRMFRGIDNGNPGVVALKMQAGWGNVTQEVCKRGKSSVGVGVMRGRGCGGGGMFGWGGGWGGEGGGGGGGGGGGAITAIFKCRPALLL